MVILTLIVMVQVTLMLSLLNLHHPCLRYPYRLVPRESRLHC